MTNQEDTYDYVGLTLSESRTIGEALAKLPFERVAPLLRKLDEQVNAQYQQHQAARAAAKMPKRTPDRIVETNRIVATPDATNGKAEE